jgi:hypothetical protein
MKQDASNSNVYNNDSPSSLDFGIVWIGHVKLKEPNCTPHSQQRQNHKKNGKYVHINQEIRI